MAFFCTPDRLRIHPENMRRYYPPRAVEEMATSILASKGVWQALLVVPDPDRDAAYLVVDGNLRLAAGCVDNAAARQDIAEICSLWDGRLWWLDCGNHDHSGQVALGNRTAECPEISPLGFCSALPLPCVQHPELVEEDGVPPVSCADAPAQSLMINQAVAGWAASYVYRLLVARDLDVYTTYLDLAAGAARSEYIIGSVYID